MTKNYNYKAFISEGQHYKYSGNMCLAGFVLFAIWTAGSLAIGVNLVSIALSSVNALLLIILIIITAKKDLRQTFLYACITGGMLMSMPGIVINGIYVSHHKMFVLTCIIAIASLMASAAVCILIVRHRLKTNYYVKNISGPSGSIAIVGVGAIGSLIGKFMSDLVSDTEIILIFIALFFVCLMGYFTTLNLLKHYYVTKYDLYSAIRFRDDYLP